MRCIFVSDLHGSTARFAALFAVIERERPDALFLGGDLLPSGLTNQARGGPGNAGFVREVIARGLSGLKHVLGSSYPRVFVILGNDDGRFEEDAVRELEREGLWEYIHNTSAAIGPDRVYGYACIPPSPFRLKHFERYDVSRFVDPGCMAPEEGWHGTDLTPLQIRSMTIEKDLASLTGSDDLKHAILLFHAPPHGTNLDRAALDGMSVDSAPLDVHIGSIAIRRLIEKRQPFLTLHGHVHEAPRLTGTWKDRIGRTHLFSAAHDGPELAVVRFDTGNLDNATRELVG